MNGPAALADIFMQKVIATDSHRAALHALIDSQALPFSVDIVSGKRRTVEQNKLQRLWVRELSEQDPNAETPEWWRGYLKLHFGIAILKRDSLRFAELYDKVIKPHDYETKHAMMMEPMDFPVTRLMTTKQKAEFCDTVFRWAITEGKILTEPKRG